MRVDIAPGKAFGQAYASGRRSSTCSAGTFEYDIEDGQAAGDAEGGRRPVHPGTVHAAKNVGDVTASELATYIVEKGKPLLTPPVITVSGNSSFSVPAHNSVIKAIGRQIEGSPALPALIDDNGIDQRCCRRQDEASGRSGKPTSVP